jgi:hypothetical protein
VTGLQFTADGSELISTSLDACACVWDAATGEAAAGRSALRPLTLTCAAAASRFAP